MCFQISIIEDYYPALLLENGHNAVSVRRSEPEPVVLRVITDLASAQETPDATDVFASVRSHVSVDLKSFHHEMLTSTNSFIGAMGGTEQVAGGGFCTL